MSAVADPPRLKLASLAVEQPRARLRGMGHAVNPALRLAIVDDYPVVVAGVAAFLAVERIDIVETGARTAVTSDVDIVLYDTFGQVQGVGIDLEDFVRDSNCGPDLTGGEMIFDRFGGTGTIHGGYIAGAEAGQRLDHQVVALPARGAAGQEDDLAVVGELPAGRELDHARPPEVDRPSGIARAAGTGACHAS